MRKSEPAVTIVAGILALLKTSLRPAAIYSVSESMWRYASVVHGFKSHKTSDGHERIAIIRTRLWDSRRSRSGIIQSHHIFATTKSTSRSTASNDLRQTSQIGRDIVRRLCAPRRHAKTDNFVEYEKNVEFSASHRAKA